MRLALISDIHGNPIALDAVLEDVARLGGVDGFWVLGDLAAIGYDPVGVLRRLTALRDVRFVQGNTDRYIVTGQRPYPSLADTRADPKLLPRLNDGVEQHTIEARVLKPDALPVVLVDRRYHAAGPASRQVHPVPSAQPRQQ